MLMTSGTDRAVGRLITASVRASSDIFPRELHKEGVSGKPMAFEVIDLILVFWEDCRSI